jgi:hypothetical protein
VLCIEKYWLYFLVKFPWYEGNTFIVQFSIRRAISSIDTKWKALCFDRPVSRSISTLTSKTTNKRRGARVRHTYSSILCERIQFGGANRAAPWLIRQRRFDVGVFV